jgi:hypothetical protein
MMGPLIRRRPSKRSDARASAAKSKGTHRTLHPSIDPQLAELFSQSIANQDDKPSSNLVDWSFLDEDDGQPGEPADWVKKQAKMFADDPEIVEDMLSRHRWTRSIQPPSTPPRYDPNAPPFNPSDFLDDADL